MSAWLGPVGLPVAVAVVAKAAAILLAFVLDGRPWDDFVHELAAKWDGKHYIWMAEHGVVPSAFYTAGEPALDCGGNPVTFTDAGKGQACNSAHFGFLYPFAIRAFGGGDAGALLASNLASLGAVAVVAWHWGTRPGLFLALFPSWLTFGSVGYSEALYVLLAAVALAGFERRTVSAQVGGAVAGTLAVMARYLGGPPLALASLPWGAWGKAKRWVGTALLAVGGLGIAIWFWRHTGHPDGYLYAVQAWGGNIDWPWVRWDWLLNGWFTPQFGHRAPADFVVRDILFCVPVLWGLALAVKRPGGMPSAVYAALLFAIAVTTTGLPAAGLPRHVLGAFPAFILIGHRIGSAGGWLGYATLGVAGGAYGIVHHIGDWYA